MMFLCPAWLVGSAMALEGFRRGFIGGSALSLFIIKNFGLEKQAVPTLNYMRHYLELEEALIEKLPDFLSFLLTPLLDYHYAAQVYLMILDELSELQRPRTCQFYWEKE